ANTFGTSFVAGNNTANLAYTLPVTAPTGGQILSSTAGGVLSWVSAGASFITSLGAVGATPNANGASVASGVLTLQPADATNPGVVTTGAQTFAGIKTFNADVAVNGGDITASAGLNITPTTSLTLNPTTSLTATSGAGSNISITTGTTGALSLDTGTTGAITLGTNANAKTITLGNNTGATALNFTSGTGLQTFTSSATTTGAFSFVGNGVTTANVMTLSGAGLTSGAGLSITGGGVNTTTAGEALDIQAGANTVGAGLRITSTGVYTGAAVTDGLLNITANSATTGNVGYISATGLTTGTGLTLIGGASLAAGGELLNLDMGAATDGTGLNIVTTGAYTGTGLVNITADSATTGTLVQINANALTTGNALQITGPGATNDNLLRVRAESGDPLDDARVTIGNGGISSSKPDSLARDQLYVFGRINSSWDTIQADFLGGGPNVTTDAILGNGLTYDAVTSTYSYLSVVGVSGNARITTGALANNAGFIGTNGVAQTQFSLNPVYEVRAVVNTATARAMAGFSNRTTGVAQTANTNNYTQEVFFRKQSAGTNWEAVTRSTTLPATEVITTLATACAGATPCTVNVYRILRIELDNSVTPVARFYIDGTLVATHTNATGAGNSLPVAATRLAHDFGITASSAVAVNADIDYYRVWSDDPASSGETVEQQAATVLNTESLFVEDSFELVSEGTTEVVKKVNIDDEGLGQAVADIKYYFLKTQEVVIHGILKVREVVADVFRAKKVITEELCVGTEEDKTCLTKTQLDTLIQSASATVSGAGTPPVPGGDTGGNGDAPASEDSENPVVSLTGDADQTIVVGTSWADLGALATDNIGVVGSVTATVNGVAQSSVSIDTAIVGEYTIIYSAADAVGNIGTATRVVHVVAE
ncbi:MAG: immunoglobulin-like domain-containing protein, partial [Minisyncoccia bacterium]